MSRTWFTDRDLGKQFPRILAEAGVSVQRHGDLFAPDSRDEQWLEHCGVNGLVAITHDMRIRYRPNELAAVVRFKVQLVVVVGKATTERLARNFVHTLQKIDATLNAQRPPVILKVYRAPDAELLAAVEAPGRVEVWYPKE